MTLGKYLRRIIKKFIIIYSPLQRFCILKVKSAAGVIYVTKQKLQARYPANDDALTTYASNVILKNDIIANESKKFQKKLDFVKMLSIGSLEQLYKSHDVVLQALKILNDEGFDFKLTWLGDGVYKKDMIELSKKLNVSEKVDFRGNVISSEVLKELQQANLYIHVSRTEGLPRSLIEALAQAVPSIGTRVGGSQNY